MRENYDNIYNDNKFNMKSDWRQCDQQRNLNILFVRLRNQFYFYHVTFQIDQKKIC